MRYFALFSFFFSALLLHFGCSGRSSSTLQSEEADAALRTTGDAHAYSVVTEDASGEAASYVTWVGSKPLGKHNGRFLIKEGTLDVQDNQVVSGRIVIDITSLEVLDLPADNEDNGKLRGHLLSGDFFESETHAEGVFELTDIGEYDAGAYADKDEYESENAPAAASEHRVLSPTHNVSGNLTLRGVARNITFPARIEVGDHEVSATAKFNIDRSEWGIAYGDENSVADKAVDRFIYNTVNVGLTLVAHHTDKDHIHANAEEATAETAQP